MKTLLKNANVFTSSGFVNSDILIDDFLASFTTFDSDFSSFDEVVDCTNLYITPGFTDVHVHFREPGFFYKETIKTGSLAAAKGGYVNVCTMPNLNPVPSNISSLQKQLEIIKKDSCINIIPYGTITKLGNGKSTLSDMNDMSDFVIAFSDDGKGVQTNELMQDAMLKAKELDKIIVAHCEDESLLNGGYIHDGIYAKEHNHKGICSESEWIQVQRDVELAKKTGAKYHVCHISTKETVDIIRNAKKQGVDITCETAPHYLILCDEDLKEDGKYKMNPPLRSKEDKIALIQGIQDGTIDMIATDHAPHTLEEKSKGLSNSAFGIVGLEIAFSLMYTHLVAKNIITLEKLLELMCINPLKRFNLPKYTQIQKQLFKNNFDFSKKYKTTSDDNYYIHDNMIANFNIIDLEKTYKVCPDEFLSMGKSTPFENEILKGKVVQTIVNGKTVYKDGV
jgi:dihydroorotase